jgi:serine/threonine-protein kinase
MAPEQRRGVAAAPTMDVFALGLVLREMLTGQAPSGEGDGRVPASADVPPRLGRVIERALARDPAARFATMSEMRAELVAVTEEAVSPVGSARLSGKTERW